MLDGLGGLDEFCTHALAEHGCASVSLRWSNATSSCSPGPTAKRT
ncbi:hypothetical protein NKH18_39515 [Streptomyces sp. M10(2022)]